MLRSRGHKISNLGTFWCPICRKLTGQLGLPLSVEELAGWISEVARIYLFHSDGVLRSVGLDLKHFRSRKSF